MRAPYWSVMDIAVPREKITKQFGLVALIRRSNILIRTLMLFLLPYSTAWARPFVVQGSTTFTHCVMEPYQKAIEASSGQKLTVVPNKSWTGLVALFEKSANFAMISGPLEAQVKRLKLSHPDFPFERLRVFNISKTHMAFAINRENPVHKISDDNMRNILLGKISNWRDVGGPDLPIRIVQVREGGGVQASIESGLLNGEKINVQYPIRLTISSQVVKVVEQLPEALGLAQQTIVMNSSARELKIDDPVVQVLSLVTLDDPNAEMRKVINVTRDIAGTALAKMP